MPELPEVETVRAYIEEHIAGRRVERIDVFLPRLIKNASPEEFCRALTGQVVAGVSRKGKYLLLRTSGATSLLVHLRMTGSLLYQDEAEPVKGMRIVFALDKGRFLYRDIRTLGCLWLVPSEGPTGVAGYDTLGPDGNSPECTEAYLLEKMSGSQRAVKAFLLDQRCVAGLGNIYVDEALFAAGIAPRRPCCRISAAEVRALKQAIGAVLAQGLAHGGTTIRDFISGDGKEGGNQAFLQVYGKEGTPCPRCGATIVYEKVAGRGTHYCPQCQK